MPTPEAIAAALLDAHRRPADDLPDGPHLVDYAESPREDDWSMRAALVRFAQPEPTRAGAVLELIRRTDGALKPHRRRLESALVPTHSRLAPEAFVTDDGAVVLAAKPERIDARAADLARASRFPDGATVVDAYARLAGVPAEELAAVPLLVVALELDALADVLVAWARDRADPPPADAVDAHAARAFRLLEELGVPRETPPPGRGARRRGR